jgi:hypothetical protein
MAMASLCKAAELARFPVGQMMTILAGFGVENRIEEEDYLQGLRNLHKCGASATNRALKSEAINFRLGEEMRGHNTEKFAGGNNFGSFPEARKVAYVSGEEIIRSSGIRAFEEDVVVRIGSNPKLARRGNESSAVLDELQELLPKSFTDLELRPC